MAMQAKDRNSLIKAHVREVEKQAQSHGGLSITTELSKEEAMVADASPLNITQLPTELLSKVISNLEPASLVPLSKSCSRFRDLLSYVNGNHLWYTAMPAALMTTSPRFQYLPSDPMPAAGMREPLLGAAYNPHILYQVEYIGLWRTGERCNICFVRRDANGKKEMIDAWGEKWCSECLRAYSISEFAGHASEEYTTDSWTRV